MKKIILLVLFIITLAVPKYGFTQGIKLSEYFDLIYEEKKPYVVLIDSSIESSVVAFRDTREFVCVFGKNEYVVSFPDEISWNDSFVISSIKKDRFFITKTSGQRLELEFCLNEKKWNIVKK